jgi:DNA transformation protein
VASDFVANVLDLLARWGGVSARRMFSGYGLFRHGVMFALVADDVLYFKADARNRADFETAGMEPFTYQARNKIIALSFWEAPSELFDDQDAMIAWAKRALDAALRAKPQDKPLKPRRKSAGRNITKN